MKFAGAAARRAAERDPAPRAVLVSGPDGGMVRRLADQAAGNLLKRFPELEPTRFTDDDLKADPGRLESAIASASLFGGAALARVRLGSDAQSGVLLGLLALIERDPAGMAGALVIEGVDLPRASKLRKGFEDARTSWSLQLYDTERSDLTAAARETAIAHGTSLNGDALDLVLEAVAQDVDSVVAEIGKLALYAGKGGVIDAAAVEAAGSGGREAVADDAVHAAFSGRVGEASARLHQALGAGANPIQVMNTVQRRLKLLLQLRAGMEGGASVGELVKNPRFGIFWKRQDDIARQAGQWSRAALEDALSACVEADLGSKRGGAPAVALTERLLLRIARRGARPGA